MNISQIDRNFAVQTSLDIDNIKFYNAQEAPFSLYGVFFDSGKYRRLPEHIAKTVNEGVHRLHAQTAGGRIKFNLSTNGCKKLRMPTTYILTHNCRRTASHDAVRLLIQKRESL